MSHNQFPPTFNNSIGLDGQLPLVVLIVRPKDSALQSLCTLDQQKCWPEQLLEQTNAFLLTGCCKSPGGCE